VGDRLALWLDASGTQKVEGDFVGPLAPPYTVRTPAPVREIHKLELLRGLFARKPGSGARARHTADAPVLVIAQGRHSVLATTLAPHVRAELFVVLEGGEAEREILVSRGVPREGIAVTGSLADLSLDQASVACGHSESALRDLRERVLVYVAGDPSFVKRANAWLQAGFLEPHEPVAAFLSQLRLSKRYRPTVHTGSPAREGDVVMYPWDVIGARRYPLRVVLRGRVLDLTQFQALHYGGTPILRMLAGTDITAEFSRAHPDGQVRMPAVYDVAAFHVPAGLERLTQLAFMIARSANVLGLLEDTLTPYQNAARIRTQRLCRVLEVLDIETLWSKALARACGADIQPGAQESMRANHATALAVLESTLRKREMPDLSAVFAADYIRLYENVLQNLVRGLRESVPAVGELDTTALNLCFYRHVQLLLERNADTRVRFELPSESTFAVDADSSHSIQS
jgi:hypothetical protein